MIGLVTHKILSETSEITAIVSNRIGVLDISDSTTMPYIVINYSIVPYYCKSGHVQDTAEVEVNCVSHDYKTTTVLGFEVRKALELVRGNYLGIDILESNVTSITPEVDGENKIFNRVINFQIKYK